MAQEQESKLMQSEEELYTRHKEMRYTLDKQRVDLENKKRRIESGRLLTPEMNAVSTFPLFRSLWPTPLLVCRLVLLLAYIVIWDIFYFPFDWW